MGWWFRQLVFSALLVLAFAVPSQALTDAELTTASEAAASLKAEVARVEGFITEQPNNDELLTTRRLEIERLQDAAQRQLDKLEEPLKEVQQQLIQLGPPPAEGATEPEAIARERRALATQLSAITAVQKQFELVQLEASSVLKRVLSLQRALFLERIFRADKSILNPRLWIEFANSYDILWSRLKTQLQLWWRNHSGQFSAAGLVILPLGFLIFYVFHRMLVPWIIRSVGYRPTVADPGSLESSGLRLWRAIWLVLLVCAACLFIYVVLLATLSAVDLLTPAFNSIIDVPLVSVIVAVLYAGVAYAVAAPGRPERRLIAVDSPSARLLVLCVALASFAYAFGTNVTSLAEANFLPVSFTIGQYALSTLVMIVFLALALLVLRRQAAAGVSDGATSYFLVWFLKFVPLLWVLLAVALLSLVFGYIALAYFIAGNLLNTSILAVVLGTVHAFIHNVMASVGDAASSLGRFVRGKVTWSERTISRLVLLVRTVADVGAVVIAIPALIAMWTVTLVDFETIIGNTLRGFSIGNIVISPGILSLAIGVLAIGVILTRFFTSWLQSRVLSESHLDKGVQDSIRTGTGYAGYILAAALALSAAGLDFSTLAIIAGALGVGIGFGLQSIVNNFVSGLILLAERPVRVGDWIVTPSGEGIVSRINVRATEIETFDNASLIIPNSNLITNAVRNWTLRDLSGRFSVTVTFRHGVNAADIMAKLSEMARAHPKVMRHPPPAAQLTKISPNGLEFEIGGQVSNVLDAGKIASDIRLAIVEHFESKLFTLPSLPEAK